LSELVKVAGLMPGSTSISHYRDKDKVEVDFVVEHARKIVGIEVKAGATVETEDLTGLKRLRDATGKAFVREVTIASVCPCNDTFTRVI
jgi:predicted AAA+ superfamily ATPase